MQQFETLRCIVANIVEANIEGLKTSGSEKEQNAQAAPLTDRVTSLGKGQSGSKPRRALGLSQKGESMLTSGASLKSHENAHQMQASFGEKTEPSSHAGHQPKVANLFLQ